MWRGSTDGDTTRTGLDGTVGGEPFRRGSNRPATSGSSEGDPFTLRIRVSSS